MKVSTEYKPVLVAEVGGYKFDAYEVLFFAEFLEKRVERGYVYYRDIPEETAAGLINACKTEGLMTQRQVGRKVCYDLPHDGRIEAFTRNLKEQMAKESDRGPF